MANQEKVGSGSDKGERSGSAGTSNGRKAPVRKVYDHTMTEKERFALQVCTKAATALESVKVNLKEGKGCNAAILQAALAIQSQAAAVLFAE